MNYNVNEEELLEDPFVLIYEILEPEHKVVFLDYTHHDEAYK